MSRRPLGSFLMILVAASGLIALPSPRHGHAIAAVPDKKYELLRDALEKVRAKYVVKPDDAQLLQNAIKGVLTGVETRGGFIALPTVQQGSAADLGSGKNFELFEAVLRQVRAKYALKSDELETP